MNSWQFVHVNKESAFKRYFSETLERKMIYLVNASRGAIQYQVYSTLNPDCQVW
jgi:hypothetical protein